MRQSAVAGFRMRLDIEVNLAFARESGLSAACACNALIRLIFVASALHN